MLTLIIWRVGIAVEALLLYRGVRAKLVQGYPSFYIYALSLFLADGILYLAYYSNPSFYWKWTWYAGFMVLFLGGGVLLEVFRQALSPYAGAEKLARTASLAVFGGTLLFGIAYPIWSPKEAVAKALFVVVQRDYLFVQALVLLVLLWVISSYEISMDWNLKGMVLGYGQCIGVMLIMWALRIHVGAQLGQTASLVQQISYLASLVIWLVALWSYRPNQTPEPKIDVELNYDILASKTREMVGKASAELVKVERL